METDPLPPPPQAKALPVVGSVFQLRNDPLQSMVQMYHHYGPIFRIRALHKRFTVLAGLDANYFLTKQGERHLGSERLFGGMARQLGTKTFLVAMDGPDHRDLRRQMKRGYSKQALVPHIDSLVSLVDEATADWKPGTTVAILPFFQRLVTDQLGDSLTSNRPGETFESFRYLLQALMNVEVMKTWPRMALRLPKYRRARTDVFEFVRRVVREHRDRPTPNPPDLIDDVLQLKDPDGNPLDEAAILAASIGPFFAGIDTVASSLSFITYGVLAHSGVQERAQEDADRAFDGTDFYAALQSSESLHAAILEALRMWPVAPFTPRTVTEPFDFAGHHVERGEEVLAAQTVTHYLEEFFPEPMRFDLDRHLEPRRESRRPIIFAPYSLGAHTCLGSGQADIQMMVTMATLLSRFDLELVHPNKPVPVHATPIPNPGTKLEIRVLNRR